MADTVTVSIGADTSQLTAQFAVAKAEMSATGAELRALAAQMRDAGSGASDELKSGLGRAAQAAAAAQASAAGLRTKLQEARAPMMELSAAGEHQAGIFREKMVMAHEALMGNFTRMGGSMMVLSERTGSLAGAFRTLITPTTLMVAAVAGTIGVFAKLVTSAEETERATNKIKDAFAAVGHAGMMTGPGIEEAVNKIALLPGVSREAADAIVTEFARTRAIGGSLFTALTTDIDKSARAMGVEAPDAAKKLAAAFADPAKGARELDAAYGILKDGQLQQIEMMQRQGDRIGAQNVLLSAWKARLAELPPGLTNIQTAANNLANGWDHLTTAIGNTSSWKAARDAVAQLFNNLASAAGYRPLQPLDDQIEHARKRLELLKKESASGWDSHFAESQIPGAQKELADLEARKAAEDKITEAKKAQLAANDAAAKKNQVGEQRKADLTDPNLLPTMEKVRQIDQDINRLKQDRQGASADEIRQLNERIALKQKERDDALKTAKPTGAPTQMESWRAELSAQQESLALQHAADADYKAQQLQLDVAFWSKKAQLAKAGSKEQLEASKAAADAERQLAVEQAAVAKKGADDAKAIGKADADADVALAKIKLEAQKQELDAEVAAGQISAAQKIQILQQLTEAAYQEDLKRLGDELATLEELPKEYDRVYNQIRELRARHEAEMKSLSRQTADAEAADAKKTMQAWTDATAPITRAFDGMVSGVLQGTQTIGQAAQRAAGNMLISFAEAIAGMMAKFAVFEVAQMMGWTKITTGMLAENKTGVTGWIMDQLKMTESTTANATEQTTVVVGSQAAQTAAVEAGAAARQVASSTAAVADAATQKTSVLSHAASSAAAVYDDVAQIPYVGWLLAPPAAAAAFAAVAAFGGSISSAAGGWGDVPADGMMTELHKNEMVLPASIAAPLRAMLSMQMVLPGGAASAMQMMASPAAPAGSGMSAASSSPNGGGAGGDTHLHLTVNAMDGQNVIAALSTPQVQKFLARSTGAYQANNPSARGAF